MKNHLKDVKQFNSANIFINVYFMPNSVKQYKMNRSQFSRNDMIFFSLLERSFCSCYRRCIEGVDLEAGRFINPGRRLLWSWVEEVLGEELEWRDT